MYYIFNVVKIRSRTQRCVLLSELRCLSTQKSFVVCVTHLDHTSEDARLQQINKLFESIDVKKCYIVLADMNALTFSDYDPEQLGNVNILFVSLVVSCEL